MRTLLIILQLTACCLAWWRTRTEPEHRSVAMLLSWFPVVDCGRILTAALLAGVHRPFTGIHRLVYHIDQALFLSWPASIVVVAAVVFLGVRPWLPAAAFTLTWAVMVCSYPKLHGAPVLVAYRAVYLIGTIATLSAIIAGFLRGRIERPARRHLIIMVLAGSDVLTWATAWIVVAHPNWQFTVPANVYTFALIGAVHLPARWAELPTRS